MVVMNIHVLSRYILLIIMIDHLNIALVVASTPTASYSFDPEKANISWRGNCFSFLTTLDLPVFDRNHNYPIIHP